MAGGVRSASPVGPVVTTSAPPMAPRPPIRMNSREKGNNIERRAVEILEGMGFKCERARPIYKRFGGKVRVQSYDFFGAFDIIAIAPGREPLFVQVTTKSSAIGSKVSVIEGACGDHLDPEVLDAQVWRWYSPPPDAPGSKGYFRIYRLIDGWAFRKGYILESGATTFPWE